MAKKAASQKQSGGGGFFSGFFGRKETKKKEEEEDKELESECFISRIFVFEQAHICICNRFAFLHAFVLTGIDSIMTSEEKGKLYTAIGYSESSHNLALPKHVSIFTLTKQHATSILPSDWANTEICVCLCSYV